MIKNWNSEQVRRFLAFKSIVDRGYYVSGEQLTDFFNEIFGTNLKPTNCGTCLRQRYDELRREYELFEKALKEEEKAVEENKPKKKVGRPKKNKND